MPGITRTSQGYGIKSNTKKVNTETTKGTTTTQTGTDYSYAASRRSNRQNQRLEELQGTIQLPMPSDIKDGNRVEWGGEKMGNLEGQLSEDIIKNMFGGNIIKKNSKRLTKLKPWILSGGLNLNNISKAIEITKTKYVDVSSGIELSLIHI